MHEERFTNWVKWSERDGVYESDNSPGIYVCALAGAGVVADSAFSWTSQIVYVGMTNSVGGLRGRLKQFDNTIAGKTGHGGADRVRFEHRDYHVLASKLLVAVAKFPCDVSSNSAADLLVMGEVARFEYVCFAEFVKKYGKLPRFNDKKNAPKYSLTVGRGLRTSEDQSDKHST